MTDDCRACGCPALEDLIDLGRTPALVGALWDDPDEARCTAPGWLRLASCRRCGHTENVSFEEALVDYDAEYDNSLHFSPAIRAYSRALAERLVERYNVRGGHVVEIGSGRGDFLLELCRLAGCTGTGYDPTCSPASPLPGVSFVPDYYRPDVHLDGYDLLVCRHVLEHLDDPALLLNALCDAAPTGAVLYLEVPAAEFGFSLAGMWDCIYPHVSYFSASSLDALVARCGWEVLDRGTSFDGQFLWVEVRPGSRSEAVPDDVEQHLARLEEFSRAWAGAVSKWRERLAHSEDTVLWGAGAKGVTFLNAVDANRRLTVVDLNPRKWGRHLPGTGHRVQDPRALAGKGVRRVLITNPSYGPEIAARLDELGLAADIVQV